MKIYQIHTYSGKWGFDCDYNYVVSSYLDENKAKNELQIMLNEQKKLIIKNNKCKNCKIHDCDSNEFLFNIDEPLFDTYDYCKNANVVVYENRCICENYNVDYDAEDEAHQIETIEVIEWIFIKYYI